MTINYAKKPCDECPWRCDVPTRHFPPERFIALAHTAYDLTTMFFACHKSTEESVFVCAGYMIQQSAHNMTLRMSGQNFRDVTSQHKLFETYRDMAVANGVPEDHPSLDYCRDDGQRTKRI